MSMYYAMVLVPDDAMACPPGERIIDFLGKLDELGALGSTDRIEVLDHTRSRIAIVGRDPRTGAEVEHRTSARTAVGSLGDVAAVMHGLTDFDVVVEGVGPARVLPMRGAGGYDNGAWKPLDELIASGDYVDDYAIMVECSQRAKPASTSDVHEETAAPPTTPFGDPCELGDRTGRYSNPETLALIEVPDAGYGRFWIKITLGKWIFPQFSSEMLDFVEPRIRELATNTFGLRFAEGCCWG